MDIWQFLYLVTLVVLLYAIVLAPLWGWMRRSVARRWICRVAGFVEDRLDAGDRSTPCLYALFQDFRPRGLFLLWGCSSSAVLRDVVGLDYSRLAEHYGTTQARRDGSVCKKLRVLDAGTYKGSAWWNTQYPVSHQIRLGVLRDLELHCDGGFKKGIGLD